MKRRVNLILMLACLALLLSGVVLSSSVLAVSTITVINNDNPGEGFNDPAPFTPVGGNPATTLGQARLIAFQHAANLWGARLTSNVVIRVGGEFNALPGNATSAVLGSAGANTVHRNFFNAPVANTLYPQALANSIATFDLDPVTDDIGAQFNSDVDNAFVLGATDWYYGLDGNPGTDIDLVSVVLHELGHGLGFQTFVNLGTGAKFLGFDDTYMLNLEHHGAAPSGYPAMSNAQRVAASIGDPNLHWLGTSVNTQGALILTAGIAGGHVRAHGPNPAQPGSSVSHFSTALFPNQLMEPAYTGANHSVGLALELMEDIGWNLQVMNGTDIVFLLDVTGSTGALLPDWVAQIPAIAQSWKNFDPNARFALATHVDFPFSPHGVAGEWAYRVETTFDPNLSNLNTALALLTQKFGDDNPESQYEAIYQILTGSGRDLVDPVNYSGAGEIFPLPLGQLFPMVIYHFTWPEVFHDRDLEPNYPFAGAKIVAGKTLVEATIATKSAMNMFFGLTLITGLPPVPSNNETQVSGVMAQHLQPPTRLERVQTGPLASLADLTGGAVFRVGSFDTLNLLQEAIDSSIAIWAGSPQGGSDADGDGVVDSLDNCRHNTNASQSDIDNDNIGDECDNCPSNFNPDQLDINLNGIGNACDPSTCCLAGSIDGRTGNVDGDPGKGVDISDLSALIDYLYITFTTPLCLESANIDGDIGGGVDISDLSGLIDYLYISFTPPAMCL